MKTMRRRASRGYHAGVRAAGVGRLAARMLGAEPAMGFADVA